MLPFLKNRQEAGISAPVEIIKVETKDDKPVRQQGFRSITSKDNSVKARAIAAFNKKPKNKD